MDRAEFQPWKIENGTLRLNPWPAHTGRVMVTVDVFEPFKGPVVSHDGFDLMEYPPPWGSGEETTISDCLRALFAHIDANPQATYHLRTLHPEEVGPSWPFYAIRKGQKVSTVTHRPNVAIAAGPIRTQPDADRLLPELLQLSDLCREVYPVFRPVERIDMGMSVATCNCCERWPSRWVRLPIPVSGDWPVGHTTIAPAGVYRAKSNRHGALSVEAADGKMLGIRPEEFECLGGISRIVVSGENNDYTRDLRSQAIDAGVAFEHNWESEVEA